MNRKKAGRIKRAMLEIQDALSDIKQILSSEETDDSEAYNKGLEDVWKLAKRISFNSFEDGLSVNELREIFQTSSIQDVFRRFTPQEALAKLEAYEKAQEEIKVGDVVERIGFKELFIVSSFNEGIYTLVNADGRCVCASVDQITKTGKHIDIQNILEQIKE